MAGTRNWDSLSAGYRKRLQSNGITRRQYESGVSLSKARGHSQTPERPERATRNPGKYQAYEAKKLGIADKIQAFKKAKWGHRPKWNKDRSLMAVRKDPGNGKWRGVRDLNVIHAMCGVAIVDTWMDWHAIVALDEDYESGFYYH
jgi:hypothetical protein